MRLPARSTRASSPISCRSLARSFAVAAVAIAAVACSDDPTGGAPVDAGLALGFAPGQLNTFTGVETAVSAAKVAAGDVWTVSCTAQPGNVPVPKPTFLVSPKEDLTIAGAQVTARRTGTYNVACTLNNAAKVQDASPETVTVGHGPATAVTTKVDPAQIAAGATALVTCSGKDAFGNAVADVEEGNPAWSVSVDPAATVALDGLKAEGRKAGKAAVNCVHTSAPDFRGDAASLEVVAGPVFKTVASVTPSTFEAGAGSAEVACKAEDAFGNAIADSPFTIDAPAGVTLSGKKLTSEKAGKHAIKCALAGIDKQEPATLEVTPGLPVSMTLYAAPDQPVYKVDDTIKLYGLGLDKFGNEIKQMPLLEAAVDPPEGVTVNAGGKSYSFSTDGNYTFTATAKEYAQFSGSLKLKCDSTGPLLLISDPKRGETRNGDAKVVVKGTCLDELSALKALTINKVAVKPAGDGSFTFDIASALGVNMIQWEAEDEWGNKSTGVQSFAYSTKWYPDDVLKPVAAHVKSGIGFWMSQSVLDSGKHDHKKPKDIATVIEIVLGTLDFGALLGANGTPVNQAGVFVGSIKVQNVKMGDKAINGGFPNVALTVIKGGMHLTAKIHKFSAELLLEGTAIGILPVKQVVILSAKSVTIDTDVLIALDPKTGEPKSEAKNTKLKLEDLKIELGGLPGTLLNWLFDFVTKTLTPLLEGILQTTIQSMVGDQIGNALTALAINTALPMKPFIGEGKEVELKLNSKLGLLEFKDKAPAGILVGLDASMTAAKNVTHKVLGSIGRAGCLDPKAKDVFNPGLKYALEIGLADDFANQLLHGLWNGGLLKLTIGAKELGGFDLSKYGVADLAISTDFMLPPMLNTCIDKDGMLKLQIGDLGLHAKLDFSGTPVDVYMFGTMQATAELKAADNPKTGQKELGFALKGIDFLELEVTQINAEAKGLKDLFLTMIKSVMLPKLVDSLGSGLGSFPLPAFDLSSFSAAIPKGTEIAIEIQQIDNSHGYTYLRGKVK